MAKTTSRGGPSLPPVMASPGGGSREGIVLPDVVAQLHPEASEDVLALVDVAGGNRAPEGVAAGDLDDRPLAGAVEGAVDELGIGFAFHADDPAHDVDALVVPFRVRTGVAVAADPRGVARAGRLGDLLLDVGAGSVLGGLVEVLGGGEAERAGLDRAVEMAEIAELAPLVAGAEEGAARGFQVGRHGRSGGARFLAGQ